jgi:hypothetical protein
MPKPADRMTEAELRTEYLALTADPVVAKVMRALAIKVELAIRRDEAVQHAALDECRD